MTTIISVVVIKRKRGIHAYRKSQNYPRRQHGEVEEDATVFLLQRERAKLRDGFQRSKGFVDSYDDVLIHLLQLGLDVVGLTIT